MNKIIQLIILCIWTFSCTTNKNPDNLKSCGVVPLNLSLNSVTGVSQDSLKQLSQNTNPVILELPEEILNDILLTLQDSTISINNLTTITVFEIPNGKFAFSIVYKADMDYHFLGLFDSKKYCYTMDVIHDKSYGEFKVRNISYSKGYNIVSEWVYPDTSFYKYDIFIDSLDQFIAFETGIW